MTDRYILTYTGREKKKLHALLGFYSVKCKHASLAIYLCLFRFWAEGETEHGKEAQREFEKIEFYKSSKKSHTSHTKWALSDT